MAENNYRPVIVVISSLVARGAVGNRIMVPALEELGFDVWAVPTIVLPFHPGQGKGERIVPPDESFATLLDDLAGGDDVDRVACVISGYLGSAGQADAIAEFVSRLKSKTELNYICDPVIGDHNGLYVPEETASAVRDTLVRIADIITPNRYEHDWLTGQTCEEREEWILSANKLPVPVQVITSAPNKEKAQIGTLVIDRTSTRQQIFYCGHFIYDQAPNGTGDLLSAVIAGLIGIPKLSIVKVAAKATSETYMSVAETIRLGSQDLLLCRTYEYDMSMDTTSNVDVSFYSPNTGWQR